ncbi:MAG: type I-F CRISPR-associated endonuclease Cas1f [Thiofilum sp.]|uniref:type I-F CRISPR-associated endonuclease Cas1f n=1 Tax=Thiofilum sp. TaxID=2212733 RepID=UPI0025DA056E|nr:type I-F CRISPR-associated endonuclease Cas1f [Thiofilum sp.]MBK8455478.1 type I-F CRISPR-associated endonuclease Cas1 [Thiofilum sp.]
MKPQPTDDLKAILHSKRANLFYLEHCRVMAKDGRVVFLKPAKEENYYWNIPIANTTVILLGNGTSITQGAVRLLCAAGVMFGFSGGGGTPLLAGTETKKPTDIEWLMPQSEYRPTEYLQHWMQFWFEESKRLTIAKYFQEQRLAYLRKIWGKDQDLKNYDFALDEVSLDKALKTYQRELAQTPNVTQLLLLEARLTTALYAFAAQRTQHDDFTRDHDPKETDIANQFLNHGNYLAYGLAATCLWVLGIPHGFAVMHGKTRRGALVFDVADLIKDAIVLPNAFIAAQEGDTEQEFRQRCLQAFTQHEALDFMFDVVKDAALKGANL